MIEQIVFAAGCFWGVENYFEKMDGVIDVKSGYSGGNYANPTYDDLLKYKDSKDANITNYTESVKVIYDDSKVSTDRLIKSFWTIHDPTQSNGQGNDIGNNYRSAIFYTNKDQKELALKTKKEYQKLLNKAGYSTIVTQIEPLKSFYEAESYHQDYLKKHPNGYCPNHSTGVKFSADDEKKSFITPFEGKEIVVVNAQFYCPYCEKFKDEVSSKYGGSIPLRDAISSELKGFKLKTKLFSTPTILFIEDGKEVFSHKGFMSKDEFYKALAEFKLGKDSKSYNIAMNKGTENRYCQQYDLFKDTPDGVFVDKLSGDILFDTRDRFNSKSGWLSFYKAKDGATVEKEDNSYGMQRVEVLAKKSGIHLGHVFPYENGERRFCINANVLEFVPREKLK